MSTALGIAKVVAGPVLGAISSKRAAKKAKKGQRRALAATKSASEQASSTVKDLFGQAREARTQGFDRGLNFLAGAPESQITPFQTGNIQAQEQISRGLPQIQNALLGRPVDLTGFQAQSVGDPASFNFDLSGVRPDRPAEPDPEPVRKRPTGFEGFRTGRFG